MNFEVPCPEPNQVLIVVTNANGTKWAGVPIDRSYFDEGNDPVLWKALQTLDETLEVSLCREF